MNFINKIVNDTLKGPKGKWSRKSLTMFASFVVAVLIGTYIVLSHWLSERQLSDNAIDVFYGFLATSVGTSALTVWDKLKGKEIDQEINEPKTEMP